MIRIKKKKISVKSKRRRRDCIFFLDQYLVSKWRDKHVLGSNRSAKLVVVIEACLVWVARGRVSAISKPGGEEEGTGWVALQSAMTSVLPYKILLHWFPVFSKVPRFLSTARQGSLGGGGSSPWSPSSGGSNSKSGMEILHLQGFLLAEVSGEFLLDVRSISLPKVSDLGTLGGCSHITSSMDLSQKGAA